MAAQESETVIAPPNEDVELSAETLEASSGYVGRWQTLVSTTNWEKGRIICEWRDALKKTGAAVTEYSDEAWARLVGDVTGQHVGRLRRTHERFGDVCQEYEGLYWSHFQTALDWPDAEMWLEGALQNRWSISQMRAKRWETVGDGETPAESAPQASETSGAEQVGEIVEPVDAEIRPATTPQAESQDAYDEPSDTVSDPPTAAPAERRQAVRPLQDLAELPDDLTEAFEQFKLAILNHKLAGWADVSRDDVLGALAALEQLALAPSGE